MRIIKPFEHFWKKIFDYIIENDLDPFGLLFEVVTVPSVVKGSKRLSKALKPFRKTINSSDIPTLSIGLVMLAFDYYAGSGRLPRQALEALEALYDAIMKDLRESEPATFEEAMSERGGGNIAGEKMRKTSRFLIDSALKGENVEQVRKLLEKLRKEEEEDKLKDAQTTRIEEHTLLSIVQGKGEHKILEEILKELDIPEEEQLAILHAEKEGGKVFIPPEFVPYFVALLRFYVDVSRNIAELEKKLKEKDEIIENLREKFRQELLFMLSEHEELVKEINRLKELTRPVVEGKGEEEKLQLEIAELKSELERVREERDYLAELVEEMKEQLQQVEEEKIEPFEKSVTIAYFGLPNPALEQFLSGYNVEMRTYSPVEPPQVVPNLPIVFNIDVASHAVFKKLKDRKPLLVSGSNAERVGRRIVEWLQNYFSERE